jgi:lysyl-tRNA synthetase class II
MPASQRTAATPEPYPHKFHVSISIPAYIKKYDGLLKQPGDRLDKELVSIAGRVHNNRQAGAKLRFYDVWAEGTRLQVMATAQCVDLRIARLARFPNRNAAGIPRTQSPLKPSMTLSDVETLSE